MLPNSFSHIPGIGEKTEKQFWASGIHSWDDFTKPLPINLSNGRTNLINTYLTESKTHLKDNPAYFTKLLKMNQHWRLFPHYRAKTAFLDIETTGLGGYTDHITTIAVYDGNALYPYVYGDNLDDFIKDIGRYDVLVTYNGKCFDIPFIENFFKTKINAAHIDLRYVLKNLGYSGGLKGCEKQLGIDRGELDGVDGYFAVLLWQEYQKTGNRKALETLLAYNIADTVNLEILMVEAYNLHVKKTPFAASHQLPPPSPPDIPFATDRHLIARIKRTYWK